MFYVIYLYILCCFITKWCSPPKMQLSTRWQQRVADTLTLLPSGGHLESFQPGRAEVSLAYCCPHCLLLAGVPNPRSMDKHRSTACQQPGHANKWNPIHRMQADHKPHLLCSMGKHLSMEMVPDTQKVGGHCSTPCFTKHNQSYVILNFFLLLSSLVFFWNFAAS